MDRLGSARLEEAGSCKAVSGHNLLLPEDLQVPETRFYHSSGTPAAATQSSALPTTSNRATIPVHLTLDLTSRRYYRYVTGPCTMMLNLSIRYPGGM